MNELEKIEEEVRNILFNSIERGNTMKFIDVKLFIKENGSIEIHHEGTGMYSSFRNAAIRTFLLNEEMNVLKKLSSMGEEKDND